MCLLPLPSKPIRPVYGKETYTHLLRKLLRLVDALIPHLAYYYISIHSCSFLDYFIVAQTMNFPFFLPKSPLLVDLTGFEPVSEQLTSHTLRFLL